MGVTCKVLSGPDWATGWMCVGSVGSWTRERGVGAWKGTNATMLSDSEESSTNTTAQTVFGEAPSDTLYLCCAGERAGGFWGICKDCTSSGMCRLCQAPGRHLQRSQKWRGWTWDGRRRDQRDHNCPLPRLCCCLCYDPVGSVFTTECGSCGQCSGGPWRIQVGSAAAVLFIAQLQHGGWALNRTTAPESHIEL
jgi:hypothetical protein